jgi:hypothetical protein
MTTPPDHPFALWTIFYGLHRWFFALGCPPTLIDERRWGRALRTSVLLGTLELVSSWLCAIAMSFIILLATGWIGMVVGTPFCAPGFWFGIIVLLPLSRWQGRNWPLSALAILASSVIYYGAFILYVNQHDQIHFAGAAAGATGGFGVGWWMNPSCTPTGRRVIALSTMAGTVGGLVCASIPNSRLTATNAVADRLLDILYVDTWYSSFHVLVAIALGGRLWWEQRELPQPSPRPAANTAATSTAKPGNHTEIAVSPDLNSP